MIARVLPAGGGGADPDSAPVIEALEAGKAVACHGGRLTTEEYAKSPARLELILELEREGRFRKYRTADVDREEPRVRPKCKSNDAHVIGLAIGSTARVLCSNDKSLHEDFKNSELLRPRGRVCRNPSHRRL